MAVKKKKKKKVKKIFALGENVTAIATFCHKTLKWCDRTLQKEKDTGKPTNTTLQLHLSKELESMIVDNARAYREALMARSAEEKHEAILTIIKTRKKAIKEALEAGKKERKKGFLEIHFDMLCSRYELEQDEATADEIMDTIGRMETTRQVRFFYDMQDLRIGTGNRCDSYERLFGIDTQFIRDTSEQVHRLERQTESMLDYALRSSPDQEFYNYLRDTYLGVGPILGGCIIGELSDPTRFRSVSAMWAYCGLKVVDNDPTTGHGGHAQRRVSGELANWNNLLKTKLLGVLAGSFIKAQMPYLTGFAGKYDEDDAPSPDMIGQPKPHPKDPSKCKNAKVMNDYKFRLTTINNQIPESKRFYTSEGEEIFHYRKDASILVFDKMGKSLGGINPDQIPRRTPMHIQKMAQRYMVKMFMAEILNKWREYRGLKPFLTYDEEKLRGGRRHGETIMGNAGRTTRIMPIQSEMTT